MEKEKPHILIVEDDQDGAAALNILLGWEGYQITTARSLAQALKLSSETAFDLYLLDTRLPDGSGIDLCKQIRARDHYSPIVFHSGAGFEKDKELALNSGAQAYVVKPAKDGELETVLARCIRKDVQ